MNRFPSPSSHVVTIAEAVVRKPFSRRLRADDRAAFAGRLKDDDPQECVLGGAERRAAKTLERDVARIHDVVGEPEVRGLEDPERLARVGTERSVHADRRAAEAGIQQELDQGDVLTVVGPPIAHPRTQLDSHARTVLRRRGSAQRMSCARWTPPSILWTSVAEGGVLVARTTLRAALDARRRSTVWSSRRRSKRCSIRSSSSGRRPRRRSRTRSSSTRTCASASPISPSTRRTRDRRRPRGAGSGRLPDQLPHRPPPAR